MERYKKIAVIGGTGKAGKYILNQLLKDNYSINSLVRNPEKNLVSNTLLQPVLGDVKEYDKLRRLIEQCGAIISCLGMGNPPSEPTIFTTSTTNIIRAMTQVGIKRLIVLTGLNVDTTDDKKSNITQSATDWMYANYPKSTLDRQQEYELLKESGLNWTLLRLPLIEQTDEQGEIEVSLTDCPGRKISATDLANFIIKILKEGTFIKQAPFIANV